MLTLGTTYADAAYGKNISLTFPHNNPTGAAATVFNAAGKRITNAPLWISTIALQGERQIPGTEWTGRFTTNATYRGRHNTGSNLHPLKIERAYWLMNLGFGVVSQDGLWDVSFWIDNVTDRYVNQIIFDSVFQGGSYGTFFNAPRMYGATVKVNFN